MKPKEKAEELFEKMLNTDLHCMSKFCARQCALLAVNEILNHHSQEQGLYRIDTYYWQQVKTEINNL
jgi:hypothetical protein